MWGLFCWIFMWGTHQEYSHRGLHLSVTVSFLSALEGILDPEQVMGMLAPCTSREGKLSKICLPGCLLACASEQRQFLGFPHFSRRCRISSWPYGRVFFGAVPADIRVESLLHDASAEDITSLRPPTGFPVSTLSSSSAGGSNVSDQNLQFGSMSFSDEKKTSSFITATSCPSFVSTKVSGGANNFCVA